MDNLTPLLQKYTYELTNQQAFENSQKIITEEASKNKTAAVYSQILSMVDLTSLHSQDTTNSITELVNKVNDFDDKFDVLPHPAAICIYPEFVPLVKDILTENVEIAAVAGGFPHSRTMIEVKIAEVAMCVADGASEIDVVMPVGKVLEKQYEDIYEELIEIKAACREAKLKVILETSLLPTAEVIKEAAIVAMAAGADFIKTSTGNDGQCATSEAVYVMCDAIAEFNKLNNVKVGIKIAGGVATADDAVNYYTIVNHMLGKQWMTPSLMRFGASRLTNSLLSALKGSTISYF